MRTRLLPSAGLLSAALAGGLAALGGCDSITSGTLGEESGPPRLVKILVQDERFVGGRNICTDLLDNRDPVACNDSDNPCVAGQWGYPSGDCDVPMGMHDGTCPDPLAAGPVAIGTPILYGGNQIRLIFSKLLDPKIEGITVDGATGQYTYALAPGLIDLKDETGASVALAPQKKAGKGIPGDPGGMYWDPTGSPSQTSEVFFDPFGPAIVLKPADQLSPGAKYTIKLDGSKAVDRTGQPATDDKGAPLGSYSVDFTVEDISVLGVNADANDPPGTIAPNDVVQLTFNSGVVDPNDPMSGATVTATCAGAPVKVEAWQDQGPDPTACSPTDTLIDVFPVSAPGTPTAWPAGDCVISFASLTDDRLGRGNYTDDTMVTVAGMPGDPMVDPNVIDLFVMPEMCMAPPMGDMAMPPADMSMPSGDGSVDGGTNG